MTKQFYRDENGDIAKTDYDNATFFNATEVDAENIEDLSAILTEIEAWPHSCLVRAQPTGATTNIRRKIASDNGETPPLRDNPKGVSWLMLDFDKLPVSSLGLTTNDERLAYLVSVLPKEFADVTYHYQWSSSAGLDGWQTLSAHLFFWLDQPWFCRTLYERFYEGDFKNVPVDPAPFTSNQIHYTAAPIFEGVAYPVVQRSGLVRGKSDVVRLSDYRKPVPPKPALSPVQHYQTYGLKRFEELLAEIGQHVHRPVLRAIAHYCAVVPLNDFDEHFLFSSVKNAMFAAGASRDYIDDKHLRRVTKTALARYGRAF
ncbi:hypothetical protein PX699_00245 [Sphingobium sp. H39-3-25]|uniref:hypothetical protein n=1 Tax=Sphingobium arseniciresistens TaxID=3030834 RepID=UPI0023B9B98C|nr:hypothetical protein [Sphingobium arseniciresistens]